MFMVILKKSSKQYEWLAYALVCASLQMLLYGYEFGSSNQTLHIPYLNSLLDPNLFSRDPFIEAMRTTHSSIYYPVVAQFIKFTKMGVFPLFFLLQYFSFVATFLGFAKLASVIFGDLKMGTFAMVALLVPKAVLAEGVLFDTIHTHDSFVLPLLLYALAFAAEKRFVISAFLLGISFDIHLISALPVLLGVASIFLMDCENRVRRAPVALFVFLVSAIPFFLFLVGVHQPPLDDFWLKMMRLRSSHHLFPFSWGWDVYLPFLTLSVFALLGISWSGFRFKFARKGIYLWMVLLFLFCLLGVVGSEIYPLKMVLILQPLRASRYFTLLACICLGAALRKFCTCYKLPFRITTGSLGALGLVGLGLASWVYISFRSEYYSDPWTQLQIWAHRNVNEKETVITPPEKKGFRVNSDVSTLVEWKDGTVYFHAPETGKIWWDRMNDVGFTNGQFAKKTETDFIALADKYDCNYVVRLKGNPLSFPLLYENKKYSFYRIR